MVRRLLVVRGVRAADELKQLGLPMAKRYENSDMVALIGEDSHGLMVKGAKDTIVVEFFDADPSAGRCARALHRVKEAYGRDYGPDPRSDDPSEQEIIGMFLYYWPLTLDSVDVVVDGLERGDAAAVEAAADRFIATNFGTRLGSLDTLRADADRDAAGHAAD